MADDKSTIRRIENPVQGDRIIFKKTAEETGGELLEFDMFIDPVASGPPQHVHPNAVEQFRVLSGNVKARIGDEEYQFKEGDTFTVPEDTPHAWWNEGDEEAQVRVRLQPATRMKEFLETWYGLAKDGKMNEKGLPSIWQLAITTQAYFDSVHLAKPPLIIQKIIFGTLSPISKLMGYSKDYPYPSE